MNTFELEICVDSPQSALLAEQSGATRLELCSNLILGGTTPPLSLIELTRELVKIPIHVLIRPRCGDFLYSPLELEQMKRDIIHCRRHLIDGIVIGATTANGQLDTYMLSSLIDLADDMHITLNRCFDVCQDPFATLETAISLGFDTILTSGHKKTALDGQPLLTELITKANNRITIMPGCGITSSNLMTLATQTKATHFHMSAKEPTKSLATYCNPQVSMGIPGLDESIIWGISEQEILTAKHILSSL